MYESHIRDGSLAIALSFMGHGLEKPVNGVSDMMKGSLEKYST